MTSIGNGAFSGCCGLTSVTIPNSVTSIGIRAFNNCSGLTSIIVKEGNTCYDSRSNCNAIIEKASNQLIQGCQTTIIPNSVTSIGESAFSGCSGLTSIDIPNSVTSIGESAFSGCSGLTSIDIPNSVTSIGRSAFYNCSGLTSVTIPNSVTSIENGAFSGCCGLTSVTIPNSVTSIGNGAFSGCSGLTSVIIPNSVISIGGEAFRYCSGLTSVTIPSSVTSIGDAAFSDCSGLTSIIVKEGNTCYDSRDNCNAIIETASNKLIHGCQTTIIPNSVTSIGESAFSGCSGLTSVTISKSVTSIGDYAFHRCSGLTSIIVEEGNTCYDSRDNCDALIETASNKLIKGCQTTIIPNSVTSIGDYAFSDCSGLTSFTIPNSVTSIGDYAFSDCSGLTSIDFPNSVTSIGWYAFKGCSGLTSITIPKSVLTIDQYAFAYCSNLTAVTLNWDGAPNLHLSLSSVFFGLSNLTLYVPAGASGNYTNYVPKTIFSQIIEMGGIVITANSYVRQYGESNPEFGFTTAGAAALSGMPEITCEATATSPAGIYPIVVSRGGVTNTDDYYVNGTLTILKAPLTIAANSYTISRGDALPTFEITFTGFKNGEDESVLTKQPTISCTAEDGNTLGVYTISVSGAEAQNYDIKHYDGKLTVNAPGNVTIKMATNGGSPREAIGYSCEKGLDFTGMTDVKAYVATGFTDEGDVILSRVYIVPAQTGIYLASAEAGIEVTVPTTDRKVLYANLLKPYVGTGTLESSETIDGVTYKNYVVGTKDGKPSFAIWGGGTFGPHKAYMPIPESMVPAAAARAGGFSVKFVDEESTGIEETAGRGASASDALYDLQGRKVSNAKSGLYVRNGKKIIIK